MLPKVLALVLTKARLSCPLRKFCAIHTVALAKVVLSRSDNSMPLSTATGADGPLLAAMNAAAPPEAEAMGV